MNGYADTTRWTNGLLAEQCLSTADYGPDPDTGRVSTGTGEIRSSAVSVRSPDSIRLAVLEFILLNPGHDSEEIAENLGFPFALVDDEVAAMCAKGLLAPE